jgi:hypothetical protein
LKRAREQRSQLRRSDVKRLFIALPAIVLAVAASASFSALSGAPVAAQQGQNANAPKIPFESVPNYLKYSADMNLGEILGVAVNSKGHLAVLNHPGSAAAGPIYGNASTQLLEFDENGKFVREIGRGVYGFA